MVKTFIPEADVPYTAMTQTRPHLAEPTTLGEEPVFRLAPDVPICQTDFPLAWYRGIPRLSDAWQSWIDRLVADGRLERPDLVSAANLEHLAHFGAAFCGASILASLFARVRVRRV